MAGFSVASLFEEFSPIGSWGLGFSLLLMPLLFGFLVGMLLTEYDLSEVAVATLLMTVLTLGLIGVFFFAPVLAGLPSIIEGLALITIRGVGVSAFLLFPLLLTGSIVGHGVSSAFLTSTDLRREIKALQEQTKEWHEELERFEREEAASYRDPKKP